MDLASSDSEIEAVAMGSSIDLAPSDSEVMLKTTASMDLMPTEAQEELSLPHGAGGNLVDITTEGPKTVIRVRRQTSR